MKSFFIADILGEESRRDSETRTDECEGCKTHRAENEGKNPSMKTKGDRNCEDGKESSCLPSWRRKFTDGQTTNLEEIFMRQKYITGKERADIAKSLDLTTKQVKTWFQNRRTKWKREKQRHAYAGEYLRQERLSALTDDFKRGVEDYVHICDLPHSVPANNWGCYVVNSGLPVVFNGYGSI